MARESLQSGMFDRRVTIEALTETRASDGSILTFWSVFAQVWAEKTTKKGREYFDAERVNAEQSTVYVIRYLDGVGPRMRLTDATRAYDITDVSEIGRREGLELTVKELRGD